MGYRSEVRCLIYGSKDNLDAYIAQATLIEGNQILLRNSDHPDGGFKESLSRYTTVADLYDEATNQIKPETIHVLDLYGSGWKWYDSYPDVQAWEAFMQGSEEAGLNYEFIRIGEEVTDIVNDCSTNAAGLLSVHSSIGENMDKGEDIPLGF